MDSDWRKIRSREDMTATPNRNRCATAGHHRRNATHEISYKYRGEGDAVRELVCAECADSYSRRPVLVNFTAVPLGTVKGRDVQLGDVIKIGGRWCRIAQFPDPELTEGRGYRWVVVAAPGTDPRLALTGRVGRSVTGRWRMIHDGDDYPAREQAAPRWEWVDRSIDQADGITTPCAVCAVQARHKNFARFWVARGADWPTRIVAGRRVHLACASEAEFLAKAVEAGDLEISDTGVGRWVTSGQVVPDDTAALLARLGLAPALDLAATSASREAQTAEFVTAYRLSQPAQASAGEIAEMTAAFGPGETIVDAITGRETRT
jgi:hypothetical protein